jgi:hypothetical protein
LEANDDVIQPVVSGRAMAGSRRLVGEGGTCASRGRRRPWLDRPGAEKAAGGE